MVLLSWCVLLFSGCSDETEEKKSSVENFTEETAHKIVQHIQEPLDKAQAVQQLVNEHADEIKKAMENQNGSPE